MKKGFIGFLRIVSKRRRRALGGKLPSALFFVRNFMTYFTNLGHPDFGCPELVFIVKKQFRGGVFIQKGS
jgi:hypothetical protein